MKLMLGFFLTLVSAIALSQITQPPGGITGNLPSASTSGNNTFSGNNSFTGTNAFTNTNTVASAEPRWLFRETDAAVDLKLWDVDVNSGILCLRTRTDADAAGQNALCITRGVTTALTNLTFGYSVAGTYTFPFTGLATFSGPISAGDSTLTNLNITGTNIPTTGLSKSGGGSLLLSAAGVSGAAIGSGTSKTLSVSFGLLAGGTKFTAVGTGCTIGTTVGGNVAGTFTLATGPCTSVAITLNGATGTIMTNGWACSASDRTAPTVLISQSASTTTTATFSIPAGAGTADVISFSCTGY